MRTQFYRTIEPVGLHGVEREGPYLVDGEQGQLPSGTIQVEIVSEPLPPLTDIQKAVSSNGLNADQSQFIYGWEVEEMTPDEIKESLQPITPRQMRLWLNAKGKLTDVRTAINQIGGDALIEWDYALSVTRDHPLVGAIQSFLTMTDDEVNQAFREAALL